MTHLRALQLIELVLDRNSFEAWDVDAPPLRIEHTYRGELADARAITGLDESIVTGAATLFGRRVAVVVSEFGFLGGSIGVRAGRRIAAAVRRASAEGLPLIAAPASGGTRMQEGTVAFMQMVSIVQAINEHKALGHPYLVYLRHPTTGGVYASWGSIGHFTIAEPAALIGFLGPKVYRGMTGEQFPSGVQTAENLYDHGLVDAVVEPGRLRALARQALDIIYARPRMTPRTRGPQSSPASSDAWESVQISRGEGRADLGSLLRLGCQELMIWSDAGQGALSSTVVTALAQIGGHGVVLVGMDRKAQIDVPLGAEALRKAQRAMKIAAELRLPLVTVIDTPGAELSQSAEEEGIAREIAHCLAQMVDMSVPTVSVILGEGAGGGAIALMPADRVLIARNSWLAPLAPEGGSLILFGDLVHGEAIATDQRIGSYDLLKDGVVDEIIEEAHEGKQDAALFCERVSDSIAFHLSDLASRKSTDRIRMRVARYSNIGNETQ